MPEHFESQSLGNSAHTKDVRKQQGKDQIGNSLKDAIQERMVQRGKHSKTIKSFPGIVSRVLELRIDLVRGLWLLISAVFAFLSLKPGH